MRKCADCNYSTDDGICLHESARDASGTGGNMSMSANRSLMDTSHCGREGRYWQPKMIAMPGAPNAA